MWGANKDIVEITGMIYQVTDAAYLFSDGSTKKDEYGNEFPIKVWLPKSQCEWDGAEKPPAGGYCCGDMQVPEWLALEKGLI